MLDHLYLILLPQDIIFSPVNSKFIRKSKASHADLIASLKYEFEVSPLSRVPLISYHLAQLVHAQLAVEAQKCLKLDSKVDVLTKGLIVQ